MLSNLKEQPLTILLDNGIISHSEFMDTAVRETTIRWGDIERVLPVQGLVRKKPDTNVEYQRQIEALFTVGRYIREGRIQAYTYMEILFEGMRGKGLIPVGNALQNCDIQQCQPALERSKFRKTIDLAAMISKGGKKDRRRPGVNLGEANQIPFFEFLVALQKEQVDVLVEHAGRIGLTEFEVDSLRNIVWFQFLCQRSGSPENYPDVFHLWTAERNGFDAVLTLEKRLPNLVSSVRSEKSKTIEIRTKVLRPLDLLKNLGVDKPDPVPLDTDRFYHWHEVSG